MGWWVDGCVGWWVCGFLGFSVGVCVWVSSGVPADTNRSSGQTSLLWGNDADLNLNLVIIIHM